MDTSPSLPDLFDQLRTLHERGFRGQIVLDLHEDLERVGIEIRARGKGQIQARRLLTALSV